MSQENEQVQFFPGSVKKAMAGCSSADLWKVPPSLLRVMPGFNVRIRDKEYADRVRRFADSIKANGYYADKPMAGYAGREGHKDVVYITDGHTRLDAVFLALSEGAQIESVPVVTKPQGTSAEDLTVALVTSNSGAPLRPMEIAEVCKRLAGYGMEVDAIAARLGFTKTYINGLLLLMSAPVGVRKLVASGKVSATLAVETLRKHGAGAEAILKAAAQQASADKGGDDKARVTAKLVDRAQSGGQRVVKAPKAVLRSAVTYLRQEKLLEDERFVKFLTVLAGVNDAAELAHLLQEKPQKTPKEGAVKSKKSAKPVGGH